MTEYEKLYEIVRFLNEIDSGFWTYAGTDGKIHITLSCNDMFYWGCSDEEEVTYEDLPAFRQAVADLFIFSDDSPFHPEDLFVCRKRQQRPQGCVFAKYPSGLKRLITEAAPPRDVDFGNPYSEEGVYEYLHKFIIGSAYYDGIHLAAPWIETLHATAERAGVKRCHFDANPKHPHYDIIKKYDSAVRAQTNVIICTSKELVRKCFR